MSSYRMEWLPTISIRSVLRSKTFWPNPTHFLSHPKVGPGSKMTKNGCLLSVKYGCVLHSWKAQGKEILKSPPPPPPRPPPPKKNTCLNLLLPHTNIGPRSKNGCLLSMFSTYTNGKLLERRFRKEFWPAPSTTCPAWKCVMGPEWPKMIMSPKMLEISLKADLKHGFWPHCAIQNGPGSY